MKILQLCTKVPFPAKDGGALATYSFSTGLSKRNHIITILAANTSKHKSTSEPGVQLLPGISIKSVPFSTNINLFSLIRNLFFSKRPYNVIRFYNKKFKQELLKIITNDEFDIIQFEGPHMAVYLHDIRKYSKAKTILRAHNVEHILWQEMASEAAFFIKGWYFRVIAKRLQIFEKWVIENVDGVIPITRFDASVICSFSKPSNLQVIPFGIDISNYIPSDKTVDKSIFYIGALDWMPNQRGLIWFLKQVWPKVHQQFPKVSLHIAGRNSPNWIKKIICDAGANFHGEVPDAIKFIEPYQIMVVPVFSGSGVRVKIIEGMAMGKAIVATLKAVQGVDVANNYGILLANNANDFSAAIIKLLTDNLSQITISTVGRECAITNFDNLVLSQKIESFYSSCLRV